MFGWQITWLFLHFVGPTWHESRNGAVLLASRRYTGSRSRKTKGSLADTLQCNIWRRAQTPHRMTHSLPGGVNHGNTHGFTALGKTIGTSKSKKTDTDYVSEHRVLKYPPRGGYWSRLCQAWLDQVITSPGSTTWLPFVNVYITCC